MYLWQQWQHEQHSRQSGYSLLHGQREAPPVRFLSPMELWMHIVQSPLTAFVPLCIIQPPPLWRAAPPPLRRLACSQPPSCLVKPTTSAVLLETRTKFKSFNLYMKEILGKRYFTLQKKLQFRCLSVVQLHFVNLLVLPSHFANSI